MTTKNWTELFKNYKGLWVALKDDETTVIASGTKLPDVIRSAENQGFTKPILTKVPKNDAVYIGTAL